MSMDETPAPSRPSPWLAVLIVGLAHTAFRLWVTLAPGMTGPGLSDEQSFHLPVIRVFAQQWPNLDLSDYLAASTPGYHIAMVGVSSLVGGELVPMRVVSGLLVTLMLLALTWFAARRVGALGAVCLAAPLITSPYLVGASTLLLPEGAAWMLLTLVLLLALRPRVTWTTYALGGLLVMLAVLTRQIFLWTAGLLWLSAWLGTDRSDDRPSTLLPARETWSLAPRSLRAAIAVAATLPAFAAVAYFFRLWGGLTPPLFRAGGGASMELAGTHTGVNPSVVLLTLAVIGLASVFFAGYLLAPVHRAWTERRTLCVRACSIGAGAGLALAIALPSSFSREDGRYSGLWNVIAKLPTLADRSPVMLALAPLGGLTLALIWLCLPRRSGWVLVGSVAGFAIAQSANHQAWQRYVEPMALLALLLGAALAQSGESRRIPRWAHAGPLLLAGLLLLITLPRIGA